MTKSIASLVLLICCVFSVTAHAQESGPGLVDGTAQLSQEDRDARRQLATDIVALISGVQNTEAALEGITEPWVQQMLQTKLSKQGMADLETKRPGYTKKVSEAIGPIIRETFIQTYPALREEQINIWASKLDEPELHKLKRFFSTNFFKKMASIVHNPTNGDFSPEGQMDAKLAALNSITDADIAEIESQKDFDDAMAESMNQALLAWTSSIDIYKTELADKLEEPVKSAMARVNADYNDELSPNETPS